MDIILNRNLSPYYDVDTCFVEKREAKSFICPRRFDIFMKFLYAKALIENKDVDKYEQLYLSHIDAFGHFVEGDKDKVGKDVFLQTFHHLVDTIKDGYDQRAVIPFDVNGLAMDGGHRLGVAAALDMSIPAILLKGICNPIVDGQFFRDRLMDRKALDFATCEYAKYDKSTTIVVSACDKYQELQKSVQVVNWKGIKENGTYKRVYLVAGRAQISDSVIIEKREDVELKCKEVFCGQRDMLSITNRLDAIFSASFYKSYLRRMYHIVNYYYRFYKSNKL